GQPHSDCTCRAQLLRHPVPYSRCPERNRAPHSHRIIILPLTQKKQRHKHNGHPAERQCIGEINFMRPHHPAPGKKHTWEQCNGPRKPPGQMHEEKLVRRHALVIMCLIGEPAQMTPPFGTDLIPKITREMPFRPNMPGSNNQKKDCHIFPPQKRAIPKPCFAIENRQYYKNRRRIKDAEQTFAQACEGRANPKAGEPGAPMPPALVTAHSTEN